MACPICGGVGCDECDDRGRIEVPMCPLEYVTDDIWDAIKYTELFEKGLPPVAGGVLDQAVVFVAAANLIRREKNYWKAKLERRK